MKAHFYIYGNKIYKIPIYNISYKSKIPKIINEKLPGQTVLEVDMRYTTFDDKHYENVDINFSRFTFDDKGVYDGDDPILEPFFAVKLAYAIWGDSEPLPVPIAPIVPTKQEVNTLKSYLNRKFPLLLKDLPNLIEEQLLIDQLRHEEEKELMKKSHKKHEKNNNDDHKNVKFEIYETW